MIRPTLGLRGPSKRHPLAAARPPTRPMAACPHSEARLACEAAAAEAQQIQGLLERESRRARTWNLGWGLGYGGLAVGQVAAVLAVPVDPKTQASLYVGAAQSALGSLGLAVAPLQVAPTQAPTGDGCADREAARAALAVTAQNERRTFFANHLGGLVVGLAGAVILAIPYEARAEGIESFALGYPVSLVSIYTQPRAAWHAERAVQVGWMPADGGGRVVVRGSL